MNTVNSPLSMICAVFQKYTELHLDALDQSLYTGIVTDKLRAWGQSVKSFISMGQAVMLKFYNITFELKIRKVSLCDEVAFLP